MTLSMAGREQIAWEAIILAITAS